MHGRCVSDGLCQRSAGLGLFKLPSLRNLKSGLLTGLVHCQPQGQGVKPQQGSPKRGACAGPAGARHSRRANLEIGLPRRSFPLTRRQGHTGLDGPDCIPSSNNNPECSTSEHSRAPFWGRL